MRGGAGVAVTLALALGAADAVAAEPFTLAQALAGLPDKGPLLATIELWTKAQVLGVVHCELWPDKAPVSVANFVGLARGLRAFKDPRSGQWVKRPLYDGMYVHRVLPGYVVQAGDPQCQNDTNCGGRPGAGDPGYLIADELSPDTRMDQGGMLAMANRAFNENGSQFFITVAAASHLQGKHTVLGRCAEVELLRALSEVPRNPRDMPLEPVVMKKVSITRSGR